MGQMCDGSACFLDYNTYFGMYNLQIMADRLMSISTRYDRHGRLCLCVHFCVRTIIYDD